jgi:hypothetical protein
MTQDDARELFERISETYIAEPNFTVGTGFGTNPGLRVNGKIFAMLAHEALVVKIPRELVDQLVDAGTGTRFDAGKGRPMKEWIWVSADHADEWDALASAAFVFVGG